MIPAEQACPAAPKGQRQPSAPTPGGACPEARRPSVPPEEPSLTLAPDTQDGAENWTLTPRWAACFHTSGRSRAGAAIRLGSPPPTQQEETESFRVGEMYKASPQLKLVRKVLERIKLMQEQTDYKRPLGR